ncbi:uncharacterized protein LOC105633937 isoform X5 [Jatropha curcas]|uniref:uncharacterized protein LOC105633937 isoform X5 n=1 Tax=Jatropha curcas TaxID=180498 RepID=UPI00189321D0|nr:uncharacterized protein LOC105633937 isoform X5 [Jatropha curcas]
MAMVSWNLGAYKYKKTSVLNICCRKKERDRDHFHPYKVIEITPPPKNLGIRCFPPPVSQIPLSRIKWRFQCKIQALPQCLCFH